LSFTCILQPNVVSTDGELVKAAKEVKHLREEESSLRQENLQLKVFIKLNLEILPLHL
jgi:hypothetical protein